MSQKYNDGFKIQAVEKALNRSPETTLVELAKTLGISHSNLRRWIRQSKNQQLAPHSLDKEQALTPMTTKEKCPQDWSLEEKLNLIIKADGLSEEAISELCRAAGAFPHHIKEWKQQIITGTELSKATKKQVSITALRNEIKQLNKELNRKNKALAETAALLVLQKKVQDIWVSNEGNS